MINIDDRILSEVDENQLFLLCAIAKHMGNNSRAWPSNETLCKTTRWSESKLLRVKKSAIEAGLLGAESRYINNAQTSNLYQIKTRRIGVMVNLADITPPSTSEAPPPSRMKPPPLHGRRSEVLTNEVLTNEVLTNEREGERNTPAPNHSNLQSQKKENGLVAPGRLSGHPAFPDELIKTFAVKAEIPPSKKVSPFNHGFCGSCMGLGYRHGRNGRETCEDCDGSGNGDQMIDAKQFEITAIASPTDIPGVTIVEAVPKIQPLPRVATTIEAETKISEWIAGEGLETVKHRFSIAKQRFDPDNAAAIAAHYCSVYTKNAANKGRLLADPITHFSDGLFSYLKNEESFGRNNSPKESSPTRNGQSQKANLNHWGASPGGYEEKQAF